MNLVKNSLDGITNKSDVTRLHSTKLQRIFCDKTLNYKISEMRFRYFIVVKDLGKKAVNPMGKDIFEKKSLN